jgi:hypothetical protein
LRAVLAFFAVMLFGATSISVSQAQILRDDFAGTRFATGNWYPCFRDENVLSIVPVPGNGFNAAMLLVNPRDEMGSMAVRPSRDGRPQQVGTHCHRDKNVERAELWEASSNQLRFGTEVWYRFSMYIDPTIPRTDHNRLVIGEWKEDGGHSPMVAQRFVDRHFTITIEQDNDNPARSEGAHDCRILVAHDESFVTSVRDPLPLASAGHDGRAAVKGGAMASTGCARDINVRSFQNLPNVFGTWTTMMYHLKASTDGNGILEVWANGVPIVRVTGRIGFRDHSAGRQYFKFGPYRDHVPYSTYAMLAKFARGPTRADVEP